MKKMAEEQKQDPASKVPEEQKQKPKGKPENQDLKP